MFFFCGKYPLATWHHFNYSSDETEAEYAEFFVKFHLSYRLKDLDDLKLLLQNCGHCYWSHVAICIDSILLWMPFS